MKLRIATWNVNSINARLPHVVEWLGMNKPHILALQETKVTDDRFPEAEIAKLGYTSVYSGQPAYNGVAILSRVGKGKEVSKAFPSDGGIPDDQKRVIAATYKGVRVVNFYVPNGAGPDSDKFAYKLRWLARAREYVKAQREKHERVVVLGDFNIAPRKEDVFEQALAMTEDGHLFTPEERKGLKRIHNLGFKDCFTLFDQEADCFSWWDYRMNAFRRNMGMRIDLILASESMAAACQRCVIDKRPRTWDRPSDHAPVVAMFEIEGDVGMKEMI